MSFVYYTGKRVKKIRVGPKTTKNIGCDILPGPTPKNDRVSRIRKANKFEKYFNIRISREQMEGTCDMIVTYHGKVMTGEIECEVVETQKTNSVYGINVQFVNNTNEEVRFNYVCSGSVIFSIINPSQFSLGTGQKILELGYENGIVDINDLGCKFSIACICLVKLHKIIPIRGSEVLIKLREEGCIYSNFIKDVIFILQACYPVVSVIVEACDRDKYMVSYISDRGSFKLIVTSENNTLIVCFNEKLLETSKMDEVVSFIRNEFSENACYYNTSYGSDKQVRSAMNCAKIMLFKEYAGKYVKDLGVGIGGDLNLYEAAGTQGVIGLDYDKVSLATACDRSSDMKLKFCGVECDYRVARAVFSSSSFDSAFSMNSITQMRFESHYECFVANCKEGMRDGSYLTIVYPDAERLKLLSQSTNSLVNNYDEFVTYTNEKKCYSVSVNGKKVREYVVDSTLLHDLLNMEGFFFIRTGNMADLALNVVNLDLIQFLSCYTFVVYKLANFSNI